MNCKSSSLKRRLRLRRVLSSSEDRIPVSRPLPSPRAPRLPFGSGELSQGRSRERLHLPGWAEFHEPESWGSGAAPGQKKETSQRRRRPISGGRARPRAPRAPRTCSNRLRPARRSLGKPRAAVRGPGAVAAAAAAAPAAPRPRSRSGCALSKRALSVRLGCVSPCGHPGV